MRLEAKATAYTLEAGIIFHSIFIGVTLGSTTGVETIRSLMIALMFHQGNEVRSAARPAADVWSLIILDVRTAYSCLIRVHAACELLCITVCCTVVHTCMIYTCLHPPARCLCC